MTDPKDRRRDAREVACFPAYVEHNDLPKEVALIADLSTTGALLLVHGGRAFSAKDLVRLELHIDANTVREAPGHVVRVQPMPKDRVAVWTHELAVEFDAPIAITPAEQQTIKDQCERLGVTR